MNFCVVSISMTRPHQLNSVVHSRNLRIVLVKNGKIKPGPVGDNYSELRNATVVSVR